MEGFRVSVIIASIPTKKCLTTKGTQNIYLRTSLLTYLHIVHDSLKVISRMVDILNILGLKNIFASGCLRL